MSRTWSWLSFGDARCPGALFGRATPQDCIDHMRLAHAVPASVKAANLGRWVPTWTVSRNIWRKALRLTISGVSTDALLFSRYGILFVHRYRVFSRYGTHTSLRGSYMTRLRDFLEQAYAESQTLRNRELVRSLASRMSLEGLWKVHVVHADGSWRRCPHDVNLTGLCPRTRHRRLLLPQLRKLLLLQCSIRAEYRETVVSDGPREYGKSPARGVCEGSRENPGSDYYSIIRESPARIFILT